MLTSRLAVYDEGRAHNGSISVHSTILGLNISQRRNCMRRWGWRWGDARQISSCNNAGNYLFEVAIVSRPWRYIAMSKTMRRQGINATN